MRNERYVPMSGKTLIPHHITRGGSIYGGAVPQLKLAIQKNPVLHKVLEGSSIGANKPVGIISPAPTSKNLSKPTLDKPVFSGGDLLNSIAFGSSAKKGAKRDNIKFIF